MYITICETDHQSKINAWNRALKAGAMDNLEGWNREGSGRGFRMGNTLHPWLIHVSSVQSLSRVQLFVTPWTTACQASQSITNSQSPPKPNLIPTNSESYQGWEDPGDKFNSKATANILRWTREAEIFPNKRGRNEVNKDSGAALSANGANRMLGRKLEVPSTPRLWCLKVENAKKRRLEVRMAKTLWSIRH